VIEGLVLAAGRSRRAGVFKPAHLHEGRPLLLHAVASLAPWCARVVVVAGHRHNEVAALLADDPDVRLVVNADHDRGMFSSVQVGAAALSPNVRGFFILPADCPLVDRTVPEALLEAFAQHDDGRPVVPTCQGRGGHPVLLPGSARQALTRAPITATLRDVIRTLDPLRLAVEHPSVLMDIDTRADLGALAEEQRR
jgi:molybdenum cofactor cytidylyltransferase